MASIWVTATDSDSGLIVSRHDSEQKAYASLGLGFLPDDEIDKFNELVAANIGEAKGYLSNWMEKNTIDSYTVEEFKLEDVIVTVSGGVAEVAQGEATIIDYDNLTEQIAEAADAIELDDVEREFIKQSDPNFWNRLQQHLYGGPESEDEVKEDTAK